VRIASLTMCYPAPWAPHRGLFVQRRLAALSQLAEIEMVCPQPCLPPLRPRPSHRFLPSHPPVTYEPMYYLPGAMKSFDGRLFGRAALRGLRRRGGRFDFDIIDAHFCWPDGVGAVHAAQALDRPVTITLRGKLASACGNRRIRRQVAWALEQADALIAVSDDLAEQARRLVGGSLRIAVLPNAVDRNEFCPMNQAEARAQLGWSQQAKYVVSVGQALPRKGFHRLLAVWPEVRRQLGDVRLILVGPSAGPAAYARHIREMVASLDGAAAWLGPQDPTAINLMLNGADLFALATTTEGWCNAISEALAAGTPVVTTDVGGNPEQLADCELGTLVPREADDGSWCDAICHSLTRTWDRPRIAAWRSDWTWQEVARRTRDVLQHASQQHNRRGHRVLMLLTNAFDPDPRVAAEARSLNEAGCDVTVLAWDRDARRPRCEQEEGIAVKRIAVRSTHARGLSQSWYLARYWLMACRWAWGGRFHAVHCHDLDTLPAGWLLGLIKRVPVVYDAHEVYTDMMRGHLPRPVVHVLGALERLLVRCCAGLITAGDLQADELHRRWCRRPTSVGNYKRLEDFHLPDALVRRRREQLGFGSDVLVVSYIANLGRDRLISPLIEAVAADRRFGLILGGDGSQRVLAERAAKRYGNIRYLGRVPPEQVPLLTLCSDVVYYALKPTTLAMAYAPPNKLYEALAAGRALLAGAFGEIARVVRRYQCGVLMRTVTAREVAEGLSVLADRQTLRRMQANAARAAREQYNWQQAADALLGVYEKILGHTLRQGTRPIINSDTLRRGGATTEPVGVLQ